jgi:hypothetical protein
MFMPLTGRSRGADNSLNQSLGSDRRPETMRDTSIASSVGDEAETLSRLTFRLFGRVCERPRVGGARPINALERAMAMFRIPAYDPVPLTFMACGILLAAALTFAF